MFAGKGVSLQMYILALGNLLTVAACGLCAPTDAGQQANLFDIPLEQLTEMSYTVYGASRYRQTTAEAPSSVTVITADEIRRYGYRTLADILRSVRGLYTTYDRNYQYLGVRGFGRPGDYNSRILLLVDGSRVNDNIYNTAFIDGVFILDVDLIERVEIIRGPGSSLYGSNAFFGVVNIITRRGTDVSGVELSGELGSYDTYKGRVTYGNKLDNGLEVLVSATNYDSEGQRLYFKEFDAPSTNNGYAENADGENYNDVFSKVTFGDFAFEAARSSRIKTIPTGAWGTVFNDDHTWTRDSSGLLSLQYQHDFKDVVQVLARVFYGFYDYRGDYAFPDPYVNKDDTRGTWTGAEAQFTKQLFERHKVVWGAEYQDDGKQNQANYDDDGTVYMDERRTSSRWGIYAQDEFRILDNVTLNLGLRHDQYSTIGGSTNPRLGVIYNPCEKTTLKFLYGRAFRAPSPYELYYNDGGISQNPNPSLDPETIETCEVVIEQDLGHNIRGAVSGFVYEIKDLITFGPDPYSPGVSMFDNAEKIKAKGLEFELDGRWKDGWQGRLSYAFADTEDTATDDTLTNSPCHLGKANVIVPLIAEKLFAGLEAQYESKRMTLGGGHTDDFIVANLTLTYRNLVEGLEVSTGVYNLFDEDYANPAFSEHYDYNGMDTITQDGISYRIKLTYRF